jgi:N-acyl-D-aspartate/D-glutamate deacylase
MSSCDILIRNASVFDGSGADAGVLDVALRGDRIAEVGHSLALTAEHVIEAEGLALAPGFIDVHTHDDLVVIRKPEMTPKISQGVTTVIVGNCGICASPADLHGRLPDPMNLLGGADEFRYPTFARYVQAVDAAQPAVNVAALVGHTALRNSLMDRLDRAATHAETTAMRAQLAESLDAGALGLSTGLAYLAAHSASTEEVLDLAQPLAAAGAVYATHMRTEGDAIRDAMEEAFSIGRTSRVPVIVSHLKCAGIANWGRGGEVLQALEAARESQAIGSDCYPYAASSTILDLRQVDERVKVTITWSTPHPEMAGRDLAAIAADWETSQTDAARRLRPAGAIYHSMSEADMRQILRHPATMIGSDGLPNDPKPHPRLWGTFPRVLGRYCRDENLFSLAEAVHKMTAMPARRFGIAERGMIRPGYFADLVLFDPKTILDAATYADPEQPSEGIRGVWVNGALSWNGQHSTQRRAGRFVKRGKTQWKQ